jgi:hypothetical protein
MTGTVYKLHKNYLMLVLSPLQSSFITNIFNNTNKVNISNYVEIYTTNSIANSTTNTTNKLSDYTEDQYNYLDINNNS